MLRCPNQLVNHNNNSSVCFWWQLTEGFIQLGWRGWEEHMPMATMSHTTCMRSTCITWTGWSTRSWRCPLLSSLPSALVLVSPFSLWFSSKRKLLLGNSTLWILCCNKRYHFCMPPGILWVRTWFGWLNCFKASLIFYAILRIVRDRICKLHILTYYKSHDKRAILLGWSVMYIILTFKWNMYTLARLWS